MQHSELTSMLYKVFKIAVLFQETSSGCWECVSHKPTPTGYIHVQLPSTRDKIKLTREIYKLVKGELLPELLVRHSCDNRICGNPLHLFSGTHKDNSDDMISRGRDFHPAGTDHHFAKFKESTIQSIRASKLSVRKLAKIYNVSYNTICNIKTRKSYKNVPEKSEV